MEKNMKKNIYVYIHNWITWLSSVQSFSHVRLFATPWTAASQASLSITNSWSPLKLISIVWVMPSNHLNLISLRWDENHLAIQQKLTQHCNSTILKLKKKKSESTEASWSKWPQVTLPCLPTEFIHTVRFSRVVEVLLMVVVADILTQFLQGLGACSWVRIVACRPKLLPDKTGILETS